MARRGHTQAHHSDARNTRQNSHLRTSYLANAHDCCATAATGGCVVAVAQCRGAVPAASTVDLQGPKVSQPRPRRCSRTRMLPLPKAAFSASPSRHTTSLISPRRTTIDRREASPHTQRALCPARAAECFSSYLANAHDWCATAATGGCVVAVAQCRRAVQATPRLLPACFLAAASVTCTRRPEVPSRSHTRIA